MEDIIKLRKYSQQIFDELRYTECAHFVNEFIKKTRLSEVLLNRRKVLSFKNKEEFIHWLCKHPFVKVNMPVLSTEYHFYLLYYSNKLKKVLILSVFGNNNLYTKLLPVNKYYEYIMFLSLYYQQDFVEIMSKSSKFVSEEEIEDELILSNTNKIKQTLTKHMYHFNDMVKIIKELTDVNILDRIIKEFDNQNNEEDEEDEEDVIFLGELLSMNWKRLQNGILLVPVEPVKQ